MTFLGGHGEDESQQAAEAMVQLSSAGFYSQQGNSLITKRLYSTNILIPNISPDESMDIDPNYDPSDFLKLASSIKVEKPDDTHDEQQDELNIDDEQQAGAAELEQQYEEQQQQQFDPSDIYGGQQQQQMVYDHQMGDHQQHDHYMQSADDQSVVSGQSDQMIMSMYQQQQQPKLEHNLQEVSVLFLFAKFIKLNFGFCRMLVSMMIWLFRTVTTRPIIMRLAMEA